MSDLNEWLKQRRTIHNAATEGAWEVVPFNHDEWDEVKVVTDANVDGPESYDDELPHEVLGYDYENYHSTVSQNDAAFVVDAHNNLPALLTVVEKVLKLHEPVYVGTLRVKGEPDDIRYGCVSCNHHYPCQTVRTIEGAINE